MSTHSTGTKYLYSWGAFHLSELTGQTFPVAMIFSLSIKTLQPDQSNPKQYAQGKRFFSTNSWKAYFMFKTDWSGHGPASPVLTNVKRANGFPVKCPSLNSLNVFRFLFHKPLLCLHHVPPKNDLMAQFHICFTSNFLIITHTCNHTRIKLKHNSDRLISWNIVSKCFQLLNAKYCTVFQCACLHVWIS